MDVWKQLLNWEKYLPINYSKNMWNGANLNNIGLTAKSKNDKTDFKNYTHQSEMAKLEEMSQRYNMVLMLFNEWTN